jgi:hypothetical protein
LGSGVERLAPDDGTRAGGILRQIDEARELDHRGPFSQLTVLADRRRPALLEADRVEDRRFDLGVSPRDD